MIIEVASPGVRKWALVLRQADRGRATAGRRENEDESSDGSDASATGLLFGAVLAFAMLVGPSSSQAAASCSVSGATLTVAMNADGDAATISRALGGAFEITGTGLGSTDCGGATVSNIDTVNVTVSGAGNDGTGDAQTLTIDLSNGQFAPGLTAEGAGTSEIEFIVDLGLGTTDSIVVTGSSLVETIAVSGATGTFDLNGDADAVADISPSNVESRTINGNAEMTASLPRPRRSP